jgi:hypothetical protein
VAGDADALALEVRPGLDTGVGHDREHQVVRGGGYGAQIAALEVGLDDRLAIERAELGFTREQHGDAT